MFFAFLKQRDELIPEHLMKLWVVLKPLTVMVRSEYCLVFIFEIKDETTDDFNKLL